MNSPQANRHIRGKAVALLLAVPVFIILSELILWIVPLDLSFQNRFFLVNRALDYPEVFKKDHDLFWRFRPSQTIRSDFFEGKTYRINDHGLRGEDIRPKSDRLRIIALGNSCTFGWGVSNENTFIERLENIIDDDPDMPTVETINAGIPGYSSFQGRRFFVSDILPLEADIVLIMFAWNDQWAAADNIPDKDQRMPAPSLIAVQNTVSRLAVYRLMKRIILSAVEEPLDEKLRRENPVYRVGVVDFYENLNVIVYQCRQQGILPILLTSPIPALEKYYPPGSRSPMHRYHADYNYQIRLIARNHKAPLIDLAAEFDRYDDLFDDAPRDPIHFNRRGHEIAAETIYRFLEAGMDSLDIRSRPGK